MKMYIKWRYPGSGDEDTHEHTFYDINPKKVSINNGVLCFEGMENPEVNHWIFQLDLIVEMHMEEE